MPDAPTHTGVRAVFLSYAREDADAARRIADGLRAFGVEVWFDLNELRGGDAWDQKLRGQIRACTLFVPVISATTQARGEGYFRREWKLAVERTHDMAAGTPFLIPVVIDETTESAAIVPDEFMRVQWTRLPGALPTPQFVEQVKKLLEGKVGVARVSRPVMSEPTGRETRATSKPVPPGWTWGALTAVVAGVAVAVFIARKPAPATVLSPAVPAASTPTSEVRKLVDKAKALHEDYAQDDTQRDNLVLAEQLCQRAVEIDPSDGEAWAISARISLSLATSDRLNNRLEQGFSQVQRALKLAPDSVEVKLAHAEALRKQGASGRPEAERILRELSVKASGDRRVFRMLALLLSSDSRQEEALLYFDRAAALPGGDPKALQARAGVLFRLQRFTEAEAAINDSLALRSTASGRMSKMWFLMRRGDLVGARTLLDTVPPSSLTEDRAAFIASLLMLWQGEPARALAVLRASPEDYFDDPWIGGQPKGYMMGWAYQLNGQTEAAHAEWRAALQLVDQRLERSPNNLNDLIDRASLLGLLGRTDEALRDVRLIDQLAESQFAPAQRHRSVARLLVLAGRVEETLQRLEEVPRAWNKSVHSFILNYTSGLHHDPEWGPVRADPRFQAVLRELETKVSAK